MKKSRATKTAKSVGRVGGTRAFVLGRAAFARVSAVEKITPSRALEADLLRMRDASPEHRRTVLATKYGKS